MTADSSLKTLEREAIIRALESTGGRKRQAALALGISRKTLYDKIHAHGLGDTYIRAKRGAG